MLFRVFARLFLLIDYLWNLVFNTGLKCYIPKNQCADNTLLVLVNGPSLNESVGEIIETERYKRDAIISVNFLMNDDRFFVMKPKYHVISDAMFYLTEVHKERVKCFFESLNTRVDWDMYLFMPMRFIRLEKKLKKIKNKHIHLVPIRQVFPPDLKTDVLISYVAKKGLLGPDYGTVMHHAIYVGMVMGFKREELYGADHTFFDGLTVNNQNQVCKRTTHFYATDTKVEPMYCYHVKSGKTAYTMQYFLFEYERIFRGHLILRKIADKLGVSIINKTKGSMIDAYERM